MNSKILFIDIETAPAKAWVWGIHDQNISLDQIISDGYMLSWAAKWLDSDKVMFDSINKHPLFKTEPENDKLIAQSAHKLLEQADIIIAHNGDNFDLKWLNTCFLKHRIKPVPPYKSVDTLKVARSHFRFLSNKLDFISKKLGFSGKVKHEGFPLWIGCMIGNKESWRKMEEYNRADVIRLQEIYLEMRPYIKSHPHAPAILDESNPKCVACAKTKFHRRGDYSTKLGLYKRYQCQSCGKWHRGSKNLMSKDEKIIGI